MDGQAAQCGECSTGVADGAHRFATVVEGEAKSLTCDSTTDR